MRILVLAAAAVLLGACAPGPGAATKTAAHATKSPAPAPSPSASPSPTPAASPTPEPASAPSMYVNIPQSDYGFVLAQTVPGAACNATATLPNGHQAGGIRNPQNANGDGMVNWVYPQPPTDEGQGWHTISCAKDGMSASNWAYFEVGN